MKQLKNNGLQQLVGSNITELRKKKNLLQKNLAQQLGIKPKDFSLIESGDADISLSMLEKIAIIIEVPVEAFIILPENSKTSVDILIEKVKLLDIVDKDKLDIILNLLDIFIDNRLVQHN